MELVGEIFRIWGPGKGWGWAHMFERSKGKTMKWVTLLKDIKEKVGLTQSSSAAATASSSSSPSSAPSSARDRNAPSSTRWQDSSSSPARFDTNTVFSLVSGDEKYMLLLKWRVGGAALA